LVLLTVVHLTFRDPNPTTETTPGPLLTLLCGAGLRPPVEEIVDAFRRRHGVRVEIQYGASNLLLGQLELTGRGDVFLPGDAFYTDEARRKGLVADSRTVAWFVPVIQVADGNPKGIKTVADLAVPGIRLGIADERAAAVGRITPEIFRMNGVSMDDVRRNVVFTSVTAPELGQSVALGHVDAVIVWQPVAKQYPSTEIIAIPEDKNRISPIDAAVVGKPGASTDVAHAFVNFLAGPVAGESFRKYDYDLVSNVASGPGSGHVPKNDGDPAAVSGSGP
jgi:molybdate transport system substrate-binding protein